jgi:hypothetical protein
VVVVTRQLGEVESEVVTAEPTFDAEGRYAIPSLSPGAYRVEVSASGYARSEPQIVELGTTDVEQDFALRRGGRIEGRVVSADGGPIEGAKVTLETGGGRGSVGVTQTARSKADGSFVLLGLGEGLSSLLATASGHHARILSGLSVGEGNALSLTVELTPLAEGETPHIELAGIGAVLSAKGDVLIIGDVIDGGGAKEAGLGVGDSVLSIDGVSVADLGFGGSIQRIRGPEGSYVRLWVLRQAQDAPEEVQVPRRRIRAP